MVLNMIHRLTINGIPIEDVQSAVIEAERGTVPAKLSLILPNKYNRIFGVLVRGMPVTFSAGYDETGMFDEFVGVIVNYGKSDDRLKIECEDYMHLCAFQIMPVNIDKLPVAAALAQCLPVFPGLSVDLHTWYTGKIVSSLCAKRSARWALFDIAQKAAADIYFKLNKLVMHDPFATVLVYNKTFKFNDNILEDNTIKRAGKNIRVTVKAENTRYLDVQGVAGSGAVFEAAFGTGLTEIIEYSDSIDNIKDAQDLAKKIYYEKYGNGFGGDFLAFGYPSVQRGDLIDLVDSTGDKSGRALVQKTSKEFNMESGFYRQRIGRGR
jgi:hypothetical protein